MVAPNYSKAAAVQQAEARQAKALKITLPKKEAVLEEGAAWFSKRTSVRPGERVRERLRTCRLGPDCEHVDRTPVPYERPEPPSDSVKATEVEQRTTARLCMPAPGSTGTTGARVLVCAPGLVLWWMWTAACGARVLARARRVPQIRHGDCPYGAHGQ